MSQPIKVDFGSIFGIGEQKLFWLCWFKQNKKRVQGQTIFWGVGKVKISSAPNLGETNFKTFCMAEGLCQQTAIRFQVWKMPKNLSCDWSVCHGLRGV